ncbi:NACHT domain-containing protein [Saccharothrix texasensis]|uniref:NACHT domain-containing protein n=1 Tax=Saccharothrix texasensis TaxID=103734 RepID=A0A3N1HI00_9PSEU|nr:NACHT domain-containing protein [Saccharothrix texasensis]ROP41932.1 NACHT domain-containing protein [Saccharothrix texasensis]
MSVEAALIALGTVAVRTATKLWLGDHKIAAEVGGAAVDHLSGQLTRERDRRKFARLLDNFADAVVDRIEPIIDAEFRALPEHERLAAIDAVRDTFDEVDLDDDDLFAADLDAGHLDRAIRRRVPARSALLSADGTALHDLLLRECCGYVIEISRGLPAFSANALTELLRRDREMLDGIREVLARLPQRDRTDGFDYDYRQLVARKLDHVEMFGVTLADASRRYPLSVAYISVMASADELSPIHRVEELLAGARRVFIRGEAGLGKTTLLQWVAVRSALSDFPDRLADWNGTVPFFIPLRRYAGRDLPAPERFLDEVGKYVAGEMPHGWMQRKLRDGSALLLVDGVDELAAGRRDEARTWLRDLVGAFPLARVIVTSRPGAAPSQWLDDARFSVLDLQPMSRADVRLFVTRWHDAMRLGCIDDESRQALDDYETGLLELLDTRGHLRKLAGYPLLCALLCALHRDRRATLPTNRMELYEVALQMLLERRDVERKIGAIEGLGRTEKVLLLADLAYWLIRNGYTDVDVPRALYRISQRLHLMPQVRAGNQDVYRHLLERSGLLREPVDGRVDFIHRTFQEYLAAQDAMNTDDVGTVVQHAHLDQWHEVVVMAVGHASQTQREELLGRLLERGDLNLLVLASLETAPELSGSLRREIQLNTARLLPPSSINKAKAIAAAGPFVLDLLADCQPQTVDEVTATIRALAETRIEEALPVIARFASDPRPRVFEEVLRCMAFFDVREYGEAVLAKSTLPRLLVDSEVALTAVKYMGSLKQVHLPHPGQGWSSAVRYELPDQVSNLRISGWPEEHLASIRTRLRLANLSIIEMDLGDLRSLEFAESVVELRIEGGSLRSFAGVERWADSLKKVSVVGYGSVDPGLLDDLRIAMPHVTVFP